MEFLKEELKRISQIDLDNLKDTNFRKLFYNKYFSWIKTFSCPTTKEIAEIARIFKSISEDVLLDQIALAVCDDNMPPQKIIDYLTKYSSILPTRKNIDALLDLYNLRMVAESSSDSIQLKFQMQ